MPERSTFRARRKRAEGVFFCLCRKPGKARAKRPARAFGEACVREAEGERPRRGMSRMSGPAAARERYGKSFRFQCVAPHHAARQAKKVLKGQSIAG
ncbi:hypothetical protein DESPIG_02029 [Desulfovibrio piger ATCC 29098]|uniref:Uncharacterized protein n=1 Tax=Desulfovibrio piger ATCC 29098 TaxID=411464 RepID=B6WVB3_9BACT|nr:hypothetical protein DESPIG_02029 [Desulfovibrio piger ATCC 29098]